MFSSIGSVTGISISGTLFKWFAKRGLRAELEGVEGGAKVRFDERMFFLDFGIGC